MTGHWTYRDADVHRCSKPGYSYGIKKLDRWKCDHCNVEWIVTEVGSDQRDGGWLVWREREAWESGPFAPGTK